ncbi:MAG: D-aminoacyl-tRNA deacylase [Pseudomonadota bacterium]
MITLIQRVDHASVVVEHQLIGAIEKGLLVFVGIQPEDDQSRVIKACKKLLSYRVFEDANGKMNLSVQDVKGGILLVPQFTLAADTQRGSRPSFSSAAPPEKGRRMFDVFVENMKSLYEPVETGLFGADMKISLLNNGPVTFILNF